MTNEITSKYFSNSRPFGLIDQAIVGNDKSGSLLLTAVRPLIEIINSKSTLLLGRRGAGKTSGVFGVMMKSVLQGRDAFSQIEGKTTDNNLYFPAITWDYFFDMNNAVRSRLMIKTGSKTRNELLQIIPSIPTEKIAEYWEEIIWNEVFKLYYKKYREDKIEYTEIKHVINIIESTDIAAIAEIDELYLSPEESAKLIVENAKNEIIDIGNKNNQRIIIVFDSMDKYPIKDKVFVEILGGFLKSIASISQSSNNIEIRFCLPEEIEDYYWESSSNILKDFDSVHRINWKPIELMQIAAYRFRLFRQNSDDLDIDERNFLNHLDISNRIDVNKFYKRYFPKEIKNEIGEIEPSVAYIMRHTQLIPRHFLLLLNKIGENSYNEYGEFDLFMPEVIVDSVNMVEEEIANEILHPYKFIFIGIKNNLKSAFSNLRPTFSYGEMDACIGRLRRQLKFGTSYEVWRLLFRIGVIGQVCDGESEYTGLYNYKYARYNFNSELKNFSEKEMYCFHPIFSKYFGANERRKIDDFGVYYPDGMSLS